MRQVIILIKQVVAVRTDLGMGRGKIAAQVGHACVMGAEQVRKSHPDWFEQWWSGQEKVIVRAKDGPELEAIKRHAIDIGIPWCMVTDAGRTQIEPGTVTCISLGPAPSQDIDRITGDMRLL